jgi:hypothetical protein
MYSYSSRTDLPIFPKFGMFMPQNQENISERQQLKKKKTGLALSPGEDGFCSLETEYNRKVA